MTKKPADFNFEQKRKVLCQKLSIRLRDPSLAVEEREKFLQELQRLVETLPPV